MRKTLFLLVLLLIACRREQREIRHAGKAADRPGGVVKVSDLEPGPKSRDIKVRNVAEERAYDLNEGKRLFSQYNCTGCHSHGGGAIGPALMDSFWIYGSDPENIHATIVEGRPNGMPAFGGKIPDYEIWQLVGYVRSLSGLTPKLAATSRDDHMMTKVAEQSKKEEK